MVLFESDILMYPNAIYDVKTKNASFIHVCGLYKEMGVSNHLFPLTLLQPELQGVDPHSLSLPQDIKLKIAFECKYNPWYYFREVALVPPQAGVTPVMLRANRGNIALIWCFLTHIGFILIQPRQTGKSLSVDELMIYLSYIILDNSTINMITKDSTLRTTNIERLKKIRDLLPGYLYVKNHKDADNSEKLTNVARGNTYTAGVGRSSEAGAINLGRGSSAPIAHIDEAPFISHIDVTVPALLAAGTAAREEAAANGLPYGTLFTTTAGKRNSKSGKYMYDLLQGACVWRESLYDCRNEEELHKTVLANATGKLALINGTFSYSQLGKTKEWLFKAITEAFSTGDDANRDFFNVWTAGSMRSPLSIKVNEIINASDMEPLWTETTKYGYLWNWYIPKDEVDAGLLSGRYVLGNDTSEAVGRDAIALVLMDTRDMAVVGAMLVNETNLQNYSKWVCSFLVRFKTVTYIIERKSTAAGIIDYLITELPKYGINPFKRIYSKLVDKQEERKQDFAAVCMSPMQSASVYKADFGFMTTGASRALLFGNVLQQVAKNAGHLVRDRQLSNEIRALVIKNERIDHVNSGHDDMVISWLLCAWLLTSSRNLRFYGITSEFLLTEVNKKEDEKLDGHDLFLKDESNKAKARIEILTGKLSKATCSYEISICEAELRAIVRNTTVSSDEDVLSIDQLLSDASEARSVALRNSRASRTKNRRRFA